MAIPRISNIRFLSKRLAEAGARACGWSKNPRIWPMRWRQLPARRLLLSATTGYLSKSTFVNRDTSNFRFSATLLKITFTSSSVNVRSSGGIKKLSKKRPRLPVDHPVTDMTTGLDLVREQVRIASGEKLSYRQTDLRQTGHSIECRIYAEVPEEDFRPSTGTVEIYEPPAGPGIRLDAGVARGSSVSYHFDPMLAKLIVWASSREAAIDRMKRALDAFVLLGVRTNIEFLHRVIATADFASGKLDTGFLNQHPEVFVAAEGV